MQTEPIRRPHGGAVALAALVASIAAGACGNLTAGGIGEATVVVSGNAAAPAATVQAAPMASVVTRSVVTRAEGDPAPVPGLAVPTATSHEGEEPEGEVEVEIELYLVTDAGEPIRLGYDEIRVRVDLGGETEADAVRQDVPARRYTELRVIFTEIEAEVSAGLIIDGVEVTGPIDVELENLSLLVSRAIDVDVLDGSSVEVVIDLNAPAWLQAVDPATGLVDESVFAALVDVVVR